MNDYINKAIIKGVAGREAKSGKTKTGAKWANVSICTEESWTDAQGAAQKRTEWHSVSAFGESSDLIAKIRKGDVVRVEGKIQTSSKVGADGVKVYYTSIQAFKTEVGDYRPEKQVAERSDEPDLNDEIPF